MNVNIEKLEQVGYVVLKNLLPKNLVQDMKLFLEKDLESYESNKVHLAEEDIKNLSHGQFPKNTRISLSLLNIPRYLSEKKILQTVLNCNDLFMHIPPMARFISNKNLNAAVPPHQDIYYNTHAPNFYVLWIPLVNITKDVQGLTIFEGGDPDILKKGLPVSEKENDTFWFPAIDVSNFQRKELFPLEVGDFVIMTNWIPHESGLNTTSSLRFSLDYRLYKDVQNVTKPYINLK